MISHFSKFPDPYWRFQISCFVWTAVQTPKIVYWRERERNTESVHTWEPRASKCHCHFLLKKTALFDYQNCCQHFLRILMFNKSTPRSFNVCFGTLSPSPAGKSKQSATAKLERCSGVTSTTTIIMLLIWCNTNSVWNRSVSWLILTGSLGVVKQDRRDLATKSLWIAALTSVGGISLHGQGGVELPLGAACTARFLWRFLCTVLNWTSHPHFQPLQTAFHPHRLHRAPPLRITSHPLKAEPFWPEIPSLPFHLSRPTRCRM